MKKIETKAEMMREFHKTMCVTCAFCKHDGTGRGELRFCNQDEYTHDRDDYCAYWEEKEDTDESNL